MPTWVVVTVSHPRLPPALRTGHLDILSKRWHHQRPPLVLIIWQAKTRRRRRQRAETLWRRREHSFLAIPPAVPTADALVAGQCVPAACRPWCERSNSSFDSIAAQSFAHISGLARLSSRY